MGLLHLAALYQCGASYLLRTFACALLCIALRSQARLAFSTGGFDIFSGRLHDIAIADGMTSCALDFGTDNAAWGIQNILFFRVERCLRKLSQQADSKSI